MKSSFPFFCTIALLVLAIAGCGKGPPSDDDTPLTSDAASVVKADATVFPKRFQRNLSRAFALADAGERSPVMACTSVIAIAAGNPLPAGVVPDPDNVRAFELCYVDVGVRYIDALLAQIGPDAGDDAKLGICARIASYGIISRTSVGSFAAHVGLDRATLDARLVARVRAEMARKCPEQIEALTG